MSIKSSQTVFLHPDWQAARTKIRSAELNGNHSGRLHCYKKDNESGAYTGACR